MPIAALPCKTAGETPSSPENESSAACVSAIAASAPEKLTVFSPDSSRSFRLPERTSPAIASPRSRKANADHGNAVKETGQQQPDGDIPIILPFLFPVGRPRGTAVKNLFTGAHSGGISARNQHEEGGRNNPDCDFSRRRDEIRNHGEDRDQTASRAQIRFPIRPPQLSRLFHALKEFAVRGEFVRLLADDRQLLAVFLFQRQELLRLFRGEAAIK